jgi:hypothetical protein
VAIPLSFTIVEFLGAAGKQEHLPFTCSSMITLDCTTILNLMVSFCLVLNTGFLDG